MSLIWSYFEGNKFSTFLVEMHGLNGRKPENIKYMQNIIKFFYININKVITHFHIN